MLAISIILFIYVAFLLLIGSYDIGFFDKAFKILAKLYASNGFVPYKDFAVVYPPGNFLLFGKLISYTTESESNFVFLLIYTSIIVLSVFLLAKIKAPKKLNVYELALLFLFNAFILRIFGSTLSRVFLMVALFVSIYVFEKKTLSGYVLLITTYFVGFWFRWDWLLMFLVLKWLVLILTFIYYLVVRRLNFEVGNSSSIRKFLLITVVSTCGGLLGLLSLYIYLANLEVVGIAYEFFVVIPSMLTKTFRNLPLPWPKLPTHPDSIFYINIIFVGFLIYEFIKHLLNSWRVKKIDINRFISDILFIGLILSFLPYALGRSDWAHFIPMLYVLGLVWLIKEVLRGGYSFARSVVVLVLFLPLVGWILTNPGFLKPSSQLGEKSIQAQNNDCKTVVDDINPSTVFVGRLTYERYLYNITSLYLIYPDVKPATRFITEEPGVQSSCKYGEMVVEDLKNAEKPIVAFLEEGVHPPENVEMLSMTSCRKIEDYLENASFEEIGECVSYGLRFKIRLYD